MRKVMIRGKEYKLAYNLRTLFTYEEIAGHPYKGEKTIDVYLLFFSMLMANNPEFSMAFDEFIEACDEDMNLYKSFVEVVEEHGKRVSAFVDNKKKAMKL